MYSSIKNVQILIALLKEYNISNIVISPGGNNIPIIHSMESDVWFKCHSVVDERSAAYYGMGLAQELDEPVALVCTSGTAVSNYLPGVTEAFYQRVPLLIITSDRSPYLLNQLETQKINQVGLFGDVCKKEVTLPIVKDSDDEWMCARLINEAMIAMLNRGLGPVHINIPTTGDSAQYNCDMLPNVKKIEYIDCYSDETEWSKYVEKLQNSKKILVIVGENYHSKSNLNGYLSEFVDKTGAVVLTDYMSNVRCYSQINSYKITESISEQDFSKLMPEIVITMGNNILSNNLKKYLRSNRSMIEHWSVEDTEQIRDVFKAEKALFSMKSESFFSKVNVLLEESNCQHNEYYELWKQENEKTLVKEVGFSSLQAVGILQNKIPKDSVVHLAILNSTRAFHFYDCEKNIKVYSNIGALGIDGCMSTFMGHAHATDKMCFLIIGDLSFFYDMNALGIRDVRNNVRILLLNNGGGSEFHFNMGKENIPTLNDYISVEHSKKAKGWVESLGYEYISVSSESELESSIDKFVGSSVNPIVMELFTDMESDAKVVKNTISTIKNGRSTKAAMKGIIKKMIGMN